MSTRYKGSILSSTAASSSSTAAYGIWKQSEVAQLINSAWPPSNDPYWTSVSMLLHGDGIGGAQNNTFIDSSSNVFTITKVGTTGQGSLSPFVSTAPYSPSISGGSAYFNGTTDYLTIPNNTALNLETSSIFTVEAWVYVTGSSSASNTIVSNRAIAATGWEFRLSTARSPQFYYTGVAASNTNSTDVLALNTWYHLAFVRNGSTGQIYINGTLSVTNNSITNGTISTNTLNVGCEGTDVTTLFVGYISNLRIVKGTAVYTTAFTPPTAPLTAITNTTLLLGFTNAGIFDNAMLNNLSTVGTAQISSNIFKYGTGSMSFSGTGAWLTAPDKTSLQLGAGDFTIEGWMYINTAGTAYGIVSKGTGTTGWTVNITSGNKLQFSYTTTNLTGATSLAAVGWYYFAVVRSGSGTGNLKIYLNGTADATSGGAVTDNFNQTSILYVGASRTGTAPLNGYIDELRITKGVARYTADFTPIQQAFPSQ